MTTLSLAFQNGEDRFFPYLKRTCILIVMAALLDPLLNFQGLHPQFFILTAFFCLWRQFPLTLPVSLIGAVFLDTITNSFPVYGGAVLLVYLMTQVGGALMVKTAFLIHWAVLGFLMLVGGGILYYLQFHAYLATPAGFTSLVLSFCFYPLYFSFLRRFVYGALEE